jgi:hypothetical protein
MRVWAGLIALALLAACGTPPQTYRNLDRLGADYQREVTSQPQTAEEATRRDTCGAAAFRALIGTPLAEIDAATLPRGARLITPDAMVTHDFRAGRLNIMSGTDGLVSSLACY